MVIRSQVDVGPAKVRRRYTKPITSVRASMNCSIVQVRTLISFFTTTCAGGVDRFTFTSPVTGQSEEYRFVEPPRFSPIGGLMWRADLSLEQF
jgi:hypothetical protein